MLILTKHNDGAGSTLDASGFPNFDAASEAMKEEIRDLYKEMHREYREEDGEIYDDEAALELYGVMYEWKTIYIPSDADLLDVPENSLLDAKQFAATAGPHERYYLLHDGQKISNPWKDLHGKELTTEQAMALYGREELREFVLRFPAYKTSKKYIVDMFLAYVANDASAACDPEYVPQALYDCGMSEETARDLGFGEYFDRNSEDEEDW